MVSSSKSVPLPVLVMLTPLAPMVRTKPPTFVIVTKPRELVISTPSHERFPPIFSELLELTALFQRATLLVEGTTPPVQLPPIFKASVLSCLEIVWASAGGASEVNPSKSKPAMTNRKEGARELIFARRFLMIANKSLVHGHEAAGGLKATLANPNQSRSNWNVVQCTLTAAALIWGLTHSRKCHHGPFRLVAGGRTRQSCGLRS